MRLHVDACGLFCLCVVIPLSAGVWRACGLLLLLCLNGVGMALEWWLDLLVVEVVKWWKMGGGYSGGYSNWIFI